MIVLLVVILSTLIGSFYNVVIHRVRVGKSILYPPSHCPKCLHPLNAMDLIPIFSYIYLLGRCRYCKGRISIRYPIVEIITPMFSLLLYNTFGISWQFLAYASFVGILTIISFIDIKDQIIPNTIIVIGLLFGGLLSIVGLTTHILDALLGLVVGGGSLLTIGLIAKIILKKEGIGGGDIKLLGMVGLFLGWKLTLVALLFSIYLGGVFSAFLILLRIKKKGDYLPFGPFISLASIFALLWGKDIMQWYFMVSFHA